MGHTGMVTIIIMVLEAAMITEIVAPTELRMIPTAESTTVAYLATGWILRMVMELTHLRLYWH